MSVLKIASRNGSNTILILQSVYHMAFYSMHPFLDSTADKFIGVVFCALAVVGWVLSNKSFNFVLFRMKDKKWSQQLLFQKRGNFIDGLTGREYEFFVPRDNLILAELIGLIQYSP